MVFLLIDYLTWRLIVFPATKEGNFLAGIWIACPVCGFLPLLAALERTKKVPNPVMIVFSPLTKLSLIKAKTEFTASAAALLVKWDFLATFSMSWFLVMRSKRI